MSDDERPRRSWREIDRNKDRSAHRKEERPERADRGGARQKQSYRAALDRLFETGKIADLVEQKTGESGGQGTESGANENRIKQLARIRDAGDRDEVTRLLDAYLQRFGELPDDLELLGRALEHRDPERQLEAMERIDRLLETQRPRRTRAMLGQLKMIRDIGDDPRAVQLARRLIERLA